MKRPFSEVDPAALNRRTVQGTHKPQVAQVPLCASRNRLEGLYGRSIGSTICDHTRAITSQISRLDSLGLYSAPEDIRETCEDAGVPFALANANTCSLSAVGYESGTVRIFDHSSTSRFGRNDLFRIQPHRNAIFDIQWSGDDKHLLTAGGDQSACLIDVQTQKLLAVMSQGHRSTIKDIKFDPRNGSICVTGGRDGSIVIWDLRSKHSQPAMCWRSQSDHCQVEADDATIHRPLATLTSRHGLPASPRNKGVVSSCSITAMLYKHNGELITACSSNSILKTWDLRYVRTSSDTYPLLTSDLPRPSKQTAEMKSSVGESRLNDTGLARAREYGVVALAQSHDGQRIYSTNKDNKVYEYAASHPSSAPTKIFEVPDLRLHSFYCKSSISKDNFLVCGNHSGQPVIIDTERPSTSSVTPRSPRPLSIEDQENLDPNVDTARKRIHLAKQGLSENCDYRKTARAMTGGHELEVTGVAWSFDSSNLLTIGDDKCVRAWRRDEWRSGSEIAAEAKDASGSWGYL